MIRERGFVQFFTLFILFVGFLASLYLVQNHQFIFKSQAAYSPKSNVKSVIQQTVTLQPGWNSFGLTIDLNTLSASKPVSCTTTQLQSAMGSQCGKAKYNASCDLNHDCQINITDFSRLSKSLSSPSTANTLTNASDLANLLNQNLTNGAQITRISKYNSANDNFQTYIVGNTSAANLNNNFTLSLSEGYLISVNKASTLNLTGSPLVQSSSGPIPTGIFGSVTSANLNMPHQVYIQGKYAYLVNSALSPNNLLVIFDISNPASPVKVGSIQTTHQSVSVVVQGNYAYVVSDYNLDIIDVSNPLNPLLVANTATSGTAVTMNLYVQGNYAYILESSANRLEIFDISNPTNPHRVGTTTSNLSSPSAILVRNNYAYALNNTWTNSKLVIFNVSNPATPAFVSSLVLAAYLPEDIYIQGNYAYITNGVDHGGMQIVDISNPASPTSVSTITLAPSSSGGISIYLRGNYAYVATEGPTSSTDNIIYVVDIVNPASPIVKGSFNTAPSGAPTSTFIQDRYLYVATVASYANSPLEVFDLGGSSDTQQLKAGGNFISFITVPDSINTAEKLAQSIKSQGGKVVAITIWDQGGWSVHLAGQNDTNANLPILPGKGYSIRMDNNLNYQIPNN